MGEEICRIGGIVALETVCMTILTSEAPTTIFKMTISDILNKLVPLTTDCPMKQRIRIKKREKLIIKINALRNQGMSLEKIFEHIGEL